LFGLAKAERTKNDQMAKNHPNREDFFVSLTLARQPGGMTPGGTSLHLRADGLPPLVARAVELAEKCSFEFSCRPEQGRLLQLLARGRSGGVIGETGTGCGVGLAWMLSGAGPGTRLFSVERDRQRVQAVQDLFAPQAGVTVLNGDWTALAAHGPFDLLVLDGGGSGKAPGDTAVDPKLALRPFGTLVIDDFTPLTSWPPVHRGAVDLSRVRWLQHPDLLATEVVLCPEMSVIVGVRRG
jgi:predicted O-methyltransferase YrrM